MNTANTAFYRAIRKYPGLRDSDKDVLIALHKSITSIGPVLSIASLTADTPYNPQTVSRSLRKAQIEGLITYESCGHKNPLNTFAFTDKLSSE